MYKQIEKPTYMHHESIIMYHRNILQMFGPIISLQEPLETPWAQVNGKKRLIALMCLCKLSIDTSCLIIQIRAQLYLQVCKFYFSDNHIRSLLCSGEYEHAVREHRWSIVSEFVESQRNVAVSAVVYVYVITHDKDSFSKHWAKLLTTGQLVLRLANERRRYKVTPSLIGWAQT